jgi:hypothetical protein
MENSDRETELDDQELLTRFYFNNFKKQINKDLRRLNSELEILKIKTLQKVS